MPHPFTTAARCALLALVALLASGCGLYNPDGNLRVGSGRDQTQPPIAPDDPRPEELRFRTDQYENSFQDHEGDFDPWGEREGDKRPELADAVAENTARRLMTQAQDQYDEGQLQDARRTLVECMRYKTSQRPRAQQLLDQVDRRLRAKGIDPRTADAREWQRETVVRAQGAIQSNARRAGELMRNGEYDRALEELRLALEATAHLPSSLRRADYEFQLRALVARGHQLRAKAGVIDTR